MYLPARHPAHIELRPNIEKWTELDHSLNSQLMELTKIKGKFLRLKSRVCPPLGYYKIINPESGALFLKILKQEDIKSQRYADHIARWLSDRGVKTNCLAEEVPRLLQLDLSALVYPYLEGRYALPSVSDMALLGASVAFLHQQLNKCPWHGEIKAQGIERQKKLAAVLKQTKHRLPKNSEIPTAVSSLLVTDVEQDLLDVLTDHPQVVHGDLNFGNILFDKAGTEITFLDFEDTCAAWFSPLMELSMVLERFALIEDDEKSLVLSRSVYDAYKRSGGEEFQHESQLSDILRALSVRALLTLTLVSQSGRWNVAEEEWNKFLMLYHQAVNRKRLLEQVIN
jgi:thiamine kinase-like enzyme